jgi:hypothetical protein
VVTTGILVLAAIVLGRREASRGNGVTQPSQANRAGWTSWTPGRPERIGCPPRSPATYTDGTYLISENGDARTWAVCTGGRWGIAFELDGTQRTAAWVDASDVPLNILAHALAAYREPST